MCVVSMVHDHYGPLFPNPNDLPTTPAIGTTWYPVLVIDPALYSKLEEIKQLIEAYRADVKKAIELDIVLKRPDCLDPEKAKLEERVAELERRLADIETWRRG